MAADGAGSRGAGAAAAARPAGGLDDVLAALEARLGADAADVSPATAAALADALNILAARAPQQGAAIGALSARLASAPGLRGADGEARNARAGARRDPWSIRAVLAASTASALLSVIAALATGFPTVPGADTFGSGVSGSGPSGTSGLVIRSGPEPMAAAPFPESRRTVASVPGRPTAPAPPGDSYESAAQALQRGEGRALARLTGLAQAGDARSQLLLAGLYETGQAGLPRDLAAARLWTRRAAGGGDRMAMHNLALFLMEGEGGARDVTEAAAWFRRAAERGVVDSQYNLGMLHETGRGVQRNLREAYRWYAVAANAGDISSRERQIELEGRLAPAERASLDRQAADFEPGAGSTDETALIVSPATTIAESQALLARRGYYLGSIDGVSSAGYATAVAAWRQDHPEAR